MGVRVSNRCQGFRGLGFRIRVYLLVLGTGIKGARVVGVRVIDLCQGFRGLGLRVRVNGYGVDRPSGGGGEGVDLGGRRVMNKDEMGGVRGVGALG